jgi:hypothetical protein
VSTPDGDGVVSEVNLISGNLKVKLDGDAPGIANTYHKSKLKPAARKEKPAEQRPKD